jgi:hypothetical protein
MIQLCPSCEAKRAESRAQKRAKIDEEVQQWARAPKEGELVCSFCGLAHAVVGFLVQGPSSVCICIQCARLAVDIAEAGEDP